MDNTRERKEGKPIPSALLGDVPQLEHGKEEERDREEGRGRRGNEEGGGEAREDVPSALLRTTVADLHSGSHCLRVARSSNNSATYSSVSMK